MIVTVRLFAAAQDAVGTDSVDVDLVGEPTVRRLRAQLAVAHPQLAVILPHCLFAVNEEYASEDLLVVAPDVIACIPPVSGG